MSKKNYKKPEDTIAKELSDIKRLLVAIMYKLGAQRSEIAVELQLDQSDASRLLLARTIQSIIGSQKYYE